MSTRALLLLSRSAKRFHPLSAGHITCNIPEGDVASMPGAGTLMLQVTDILICIT